MQSDTSQQIQAIPPQEQLPLVGSHDGSSKVISAGNALVVKDDLVVKPSRHQEGAASSASSSTDGWPSSGAFLLGMHNYSNLPSNLPEFVMEHQAALTFPEKLMLMLTYAERDYSPPENGNDVDREAAVGWTLDGRAFIIRNKDDLVKGLLPMFFRQGKLASFTRKLYRWGFRQVSVSPDGLSSKKKMIFGHEWFQRDNKQLMASMRSITAAGTRRRALGSSKQKSKSASERNVVLEPKVLIPNTVHTQFMLLPAMSSSTPGPSGPMSASFVYKATGGTTPHTSQQMMTTNSILGNMISRPPATMASTPFLLQGHNAPLVSRIQHQGDEQAGMHPMAGGNGYLTSLAHLGAQGRTFQDLQGQPMDGSDPNAYMRAAIDMLLRHASTNSTSTNDRNAG